MVVGIETHIKRGFEQTAARTVPALPDLRPMLISPRQVVRRLADSVVRAEAAVFERRPRTLGEVGKPIVVATHRRSGTHLTIDTLRRNFPECRPRLLPLESLHRTYLNLDRMNTNSDEPITEADALRILGKARRPTIKTHSGPFFGAIIEEHKPFVSGLLERADVLHISRDGRKVMCSLWAWRRSFDPAARVPFAEFIRQTDARGWSRPRVWADHLLRWLDAPGAIHCRFDDLVKRPADTLGMIAERFGLEFQPADPPIPPPVTGRYAAWAARLRGDLGSTNHYAHGQRTPKPEEVFDAESRAFFEREAGEAMERLGQSPPPLPST